MSSSNGNGAVLRLLDANANRGREALRVWEDYARFFLCDKAISLEIKSLRHDLSAALEGITAHAILFRDTPGDVGTDNKVPREMSRSGVAEVVTAAGKRLGEALRTISEFCKIADPEAAAKIEKIRYAAYHLEARLARTLSTNERFSKVRLYVLLTESICKIPWLDAAKGAIAGGADCIQLREKSLPGGELLKRAKLLVAECKAGNVLCIINDRLDIAILSGADGVHLGQEDLPAAEIRNLVGRELVIGVSTHSMSQAKQAVRDGADYIGIGPIFPSKTKPRDFLVGPAKAKEVAQTIKIPAVAIAGINHTNVDEVMATGVAAVAVTAAVLDTDDVRGATERLKEKLRPAEPAGELRSSG